MEANLKAAAQAALEKIAGVLRKEADMIVVENASKAVKADIVKNPAHYTWMKIQPKQFIMHNAMEFWRGAIIKYAARAGFKIYDGMDARESEIKDLEKAIDFARMRIAHLNGEMDL